MKCAKFMKAKNEKLKIGAMSIGATIAVGMAVVITVLVIAIPYREKSKPNGEYN